LDFQTRSGNEFSPWALGTSRQGIIIPLAADFNFGHLVREAIIRESELDDDDTEGCAFEAVSMPSSSCSLSLLPRAADTPASQQQSGPSHAMANTTASQPSTSPESPAYEVPKYTQGSVENSLRKKRGHAKRAMQRLERKRAAPFGDYAVKPSVLNRHVRPASAIQSGLKTKKLKHTKNAWTGARDEGGHKRVFILDEMVGEGSIFHFRLERWDGR
jgi:hypothetical protein